MKLKKPSLFLIIIYIISVLCWVILNIFYQPLPIQSTNLFDILIFVIPFYGAVIGLIRSKSWGGYSSLMGKSILFFSLGLLAWSLGTLVWICYTVFLNIDVPYPSLADLFYVFNALCWTIGVVYLAIISSAALVLRTRLQKLLFLIVPSLTLLFSYFLLFVIGKNNHLDWSGTPLQSFLDLYYISADAFALALIATALLVVKPRLFGQYKFPITLLFFGLVLMYFSDFSFSYNITRGTYVNDSFPDLLYITTMFVLSLGLAFIDSNPVEEIEK